MSAGYIIVYDDSADRYSARRYQRKATERTLAREIVALQAAGRVIVEVRRGEV